MSKEVIRKITEYGWRSCEDGFGEGAKMFLTNLGHPGPQILLRIPTYSDFPEIYAMSRALKHLRGYLFVAEERSMETWDSVASEDNIRFGLVKVDPNARINPTFLDKKHRLFNVMNEMGRFTCKDGLKTSKDWFIETFETRMTFLHGFEPTRTTENMRELWDLLQIAGEMLGEDQEATMIPT